MLLSDQDLRRALNSRQLHIRPFDPQSVQPASIDLQLGHSFQVYRPTDEPVDPHRSPPQPVLYQCDTGQIFTLRPGQFVLGTTQETVTLSSSVAARLEGKSSLGRLGLQTHATAGFIDPGFSGQITLELSNLGPWPVQLRAGMPIAQLCVYSLSSQAERPYGHPDLGSRYQHQLGATPSRYHRNRTIDTTPSV